MSRKTLTAALLMATGVNVQAALTAGDVAIIGFIDNGTPDSFGFVTLAEINAGETIYFTDNGWTGSGFRSASATDGDGNENLIKWTANSTVAAGTIIGSLTTDTAWTWTKSGAVPGGTSGSFADLALSQSGEQIYAFQANGSLPLQNPTTHLFVLDDTHGFENATSSTTGSVAPGLQAGLTALTFNFTSANYVAVKSTALAGTHDKAGWLAVFADAANWTTGASGALPSGNISVQAVPVPAAAWLFGPALLGLVPANRRKA